MRGQAGVVFVLIRLAAVDGIDVHGGLACTVWHDRHVGVPRGHGGKELFLEFRKHRSHMPHGTVAQKRHRAMGNLAMGLDLGPPAAAMAKTDPVLVQRLGNDDVLHAGRIEIAPLCKVRDAAVTAGLLVRRARNLNRAGIVWMRIYKGLDRYDGGRKPPFHVAGAASVYPAIDKRATEGVLCPAFADFHDVDMAVEVHAISRAPTCATGDDIPAGISLAVAGRAFGAHQFDCETARAQTGGDVLADLAILGTRWV